jgi:hypothetical protein
VNVAARIAEYARPGEVVVSREVADAAATASVSFIEIGPVELKGVPGPVPCTQQRATPEPDLGPIVKWDELDSNKRPTDYESMASGCAVPSDIGSRRTG